MKYEASWHRLWLHASLHCLLPIITSAFDWHSAKYVSKYDISSRFGFVDVAQLQLYDPACVSDLRTDRTEVGQPWYRSMKSQQAYQVMLKLEAV